MVKLDIKAVEDGGKFDNVISKSPKDIQEISRALRKVLADTMPGVTEVAWETQGVVGYGIGPKKMSEHFCYIAPYKNHVNLGFMYGADLEDTQGLFEGTGKSLRHIKVSTVKDAKSASLKKLVKQASQHLPKLNR